MSSKKVSEKSAYILRPINNQHQNKPPAASKVVTMASRIYRTSSQPTAALTLLLWTAFSAAAFVPQPGASSHRTFIAPRGGRRSAPPSSSSSRLQGVIYYPDGTTEDDSSGDQSILFEDNVTVKRPAALQSPAWNAPLARLAARHAPSGGLDVTRIDEIRIIGCTDRHCDIEAVVCEDDGCVSLSVPVALLNPCDQGDGDDTYFDDCVMENLEQLDRSIDPGELLAGSASAAASQEDVAAHERMLAELHNAHTVRYPKWWHFPDDDLELAQQGESLLRILGEPDFAPEIMKLVLRHVIVDPGDNLFVGEAAVVAVGPAGLILRCSAMVREADDRAKLVEMIQVPLQFETPALTPDSLRDAVLDMVEEGEAQA